MAEAEPSNSDVPVINFKMEGEAIYAAAYWYAASRKIITEICMPQTRMVRLPLETTVLRIRS